MRIKCVFEISEIEFLQMKDTDFRKHIEYHKSKLARDLSLIIQKHIPLRQADFGKQSYSMDLLITPTDKYLEVKERLRTLLFKLDRETYLKVGELLNELETCNEQPIELNQKQP